MKKVAVEDGSGGAATVVPYARFLEVRQRRHRVVAELRHPSLGNRLRTDRPRPLIVDAEPSRDKQCGTRPDVENE
jgi:hypothetical protein